MGGYSYENSLIQEKRLHTLIFNKATGIFALCFSDTIYFNIHNFIYTEYN